MERANRGPWAFVIALFGLGAFLISAALQIEPTFERPLEINWVVLAAGFALAEKYSVHLEVRREAHSLTFSEIPLTVGLIFADPTGLIVARLVGGAVGHAIARRPRLVKYAFNVSQFAIDVPTALLVFYAILGPSASPIDPIGWAACFTSVAVAHTLGWLCVSAVIRIAGAPLTLRASLRVLAVSLTAGLAECAVVLGAAVTLWRDSRSWVLIAVIGLGLSYFFLAFLRIRERHQSLDNLHTFTTTLAEDDLETVTESVLRGVAELLQAAKVSIVVPAGDELTRIDYDGERVIRSSWTPARTNVEVLALFARDRNLVAPGLAAHDDPLGDLRSDGAIVAALPMLERNGVIVAEGRMSDARDFDDEDVQLLETAAVHASAALHNAQLVQRLRAEAATRARQALHDDLTDLPNQRGLLEQVHEQLRRDGGALSLLTVRLNSLREVNETLGRTIADDMLVQVAARLRPLGPGTACARSESDEFTLIVPGDGEVATAMAHRIIEAFELPVLCGDVALAATVGVGIANAPEHGSDPEVLLRRASLAASRTEVEGTSVSTWAADRDPYDPQRLTIAADLRDAIPSGELEVHFQPQLDLTGDRIVGAEALVRWQHPRLGHLRPDQFIAAAENTGAINALTLHVLTVAAQAGARWRRHGWNLDVGVNLSARNLTHHGFADEVSAILDRTGFPATSLIMELTESSVMTEAERALGTLDDLERLGVALSIDDFGTGYSSLAHLRRLPVREIKIDKSFVLDLTTSESDEAIVRSMIELGHNLGLTVVVEGVETVEVRDRVEELGADRLQGYLLSRPMGLTAFEHWIVERHMRDHVDPDHRVLRFEQRR